MKPQIIQKIIAFIVFYVVMYVYFYFRENGNVFWPVHFILLLTSILFAYSFTSFTKKLVISYAPDTGKEYLAVLRVNLFRNRFITDGGFLYIYKDKIDFVSYNDKIIVCFDIKTIKYYSYFRFLGLIKTGITIHLKSGKKYILIVDKTEETYEMLLKTFEQHAILNKE